MKAYLKNKVNHKVKSYRTSCTSLDLYHKGILIRFEIKNVKLDEEKPLHRSYANNTQMPCRMPCDMHINAL